MGAVSLAVVKNCICLVEKNCPVKKKIIVQLALCHILQLGID